MIYINENDLKFSTFDEIKDKRFVGLTIYPRKKIHKDSKYKCMLLELRDKEDNLFYIKGTETDVLQFTNMDCFEIDLKDGKYTNFYRFRHLLDYGYSTFEGFKITYIGDTIEIEG